MIPPASAETSIRYAVEPVRRVTVVRWPSDTFSVHRYGYVYAGRDSGRFSPFFLPIMRAPESPLSPATTGECRQGWLSAEPPERTCHHKGHKGDSGDCQSCAAAHITRGKTVRPRKFSGPNLSYSKILVLELRRQELAVQAGDGSPLFKGDSGDCQSCAAAHIARGKTVRPRKPSGPNLSYSKILVLELR